MGNEGKILDLILDGAGRDASMLTHDLKAIGNGDMAEGIAQVADFAARSGFEVGHLSGMKKGVCIGLVVGAAGYGISRLYKWHINKVEKRAAMWQRFEDQGREAHKEHWTEYEELKAKAEQDEAKERELEGGEA